MSTPRIISFAVLVVAVLGGIIYINSQNASPAPVDGAGAIQPTMNKAAESEPRSYERAAKVKLYPVAKDITTPDGFINTGLNPDRSAKPITIGEFIGKKVILVDFWTFSCINCQRTTPYLNAWYEKYKDKGLVIIGMHTPEFGFEKVYQNVLDATKRMGIKYPVVLDNDFSTWRAYGNRNWPHKYLIDIDGFVVYDHIGEGKYEETEKKIQELLKERSDVLRMAEQIPTDVALANPNDHDRNPQSPEIYFGASRNSYLGNGASGEIGTQTLEEAAGIKTNILYLSGTWNFKDEFAENKNAGAMPIGRQAKIIFRYQAKDVYMVASSANGVRVKVLLDGVPVGSEAGEDVKQGTLTIKEDRLYKIIQDSKWGEHTLELIIENPGLRAFTFTFG